MRGLTLQSNDERIYMTRFLKVCVILAVLFQAFVGTVKAQDIKGDVVDSKTKEPLIGAAVKVEGTQRAAVTDAEGKFTISGLILDNQKGDTQGNATKGLMKLNRIVFAGMDIVGSDFNKVYKDNLYDYTSGKTDDTKPSFSSTFFKEAANQNKIFDDWAAMQHSNLASIIAAATKDATITASFDGLTGFDVVNYVGCFSGSGDTWAQGWTEFDPENAAYYKSCK